MAFIKTYDGPVLSAAQATYTIDPGEEIPAGSVAVAVISINAVDATVNAPDGTWTKVAEEQGAVALTSAVFVKSFTVAETATYTFTNSLGSNKAYQGGIALYSGRDTTTPVHRFASMNGTSLGSSTTIEIPALASDPTINGCDILRVGVIGAATTAATINMPATQRATWQTGGTAPKRPAALSDTTQGTAAPVGATSATTTAGSTTARAGFTLALAPSAAPTVETLRPTSINNLSNMTGAVTDIDEDPDVSNGADPLLATDPSGTVTSHGVQDPDTPSQAVTGFTATTLTSEANLFDTSDSTAATHAPGTNNVDYGRYFQFNAADFTGIPSNAIITGMTVRVRAAANTNNRLSLWIQAMASNGGTVIGQEGQTDGGTAISTTITDYGSNLVPAMNAIPTRAQLVSGTFGLRLRWRRSNTVTLSLYRIQVTVSYRVPQTINTSVRVLLGDPSGTLAVGATSGEIRMSVNRKGTPTSGNPTARAELHENGSVTNLATVIPETSVVSGASAVLSGTFNQNLITNKNNVEIWFFGTGVEGATVELDAVEWNAQMAAGANTPLTLSFGATATASVVRGASKLVSLAASNVFTGAKATAKSIVYSASSALTPKKTANKGMPFSAVTALTTTPVKVFLKLLSFSVSAGYTLGQRLVTKALSIASGASTTVSKAPSKRASFGVSVSAAVQAVRTFLKKLDIAVASTLSMKKAVAKTTSFATSISAVVSGIKVQLKTVSLSVTASPTIQRAVGRTTSFSANATLTAKKAMSRAFAFGASAAATVHKAGTKVFSLPVSVTATATGIKVQLKTIALSVSATPTVRKAVTHTNNYVSNISVTISRNFSRLVSAAISTALTARRAVGKPLAFAGTLTAAINALKVQLRTIALGVSTSLAAPKKAVSKVIQPPLSTVFSMQQKNINKALVLTVGVAVDIRKSVSKVFALAASAVASLGTLKSKIQNLTFNVSSLPVVSRAVNSVKSFSVSAESAEPKKGVLKVIGLTLTVPVTIIKSVNKTLVSVVNIATSVYNAIAGVLGAKPVVVFRRAAKNTGTFFTRVKQVGEFATRVKQSARFWRR